MLVVNAGSSSLKLTLLGDEDETLAERELRAPRAQILPQQLLNQSHAEKCRRENQDRVENIEMPTDPIVLTTGDL